MTSSYITPFDQNGGMFFGFNNPFRKETNKSKANADIPTLDFPKLNKPSTLNADAPSWDWRVLFQPLQRALNPGTPLFKDIPNHNKLNKIHVNNNKSIQTQTNTTNSLLISQLDESVVAKEKIDSSRFDTVNDDKILAMHGYKKTKQITKSLQGEVYEGKILKHKLSLLEEFGLKTRRIVIKRVSKELYKSKITKENGSSILVNEDVVKEAILQHYLTVDNRVSGNYISQLLSYIETDNNYYIISEYGGESNLKQFVKKAHKFIKKKKLKLTSWYKICKFLFWQLAATINWMHNDMNLCHLDLTLENIIVSNGKFILKSNGSVEVDKKLSFKIADFGLSEVFKNKPKYNQSYFEYNADDNILSTFHINNKYGNLNPLQAPKIFNEEVYDARKADIWSLGIILFYMTCGIYPYDKPINGDTGYLFVKQRKMDLLLTMKNISHHYDKKLMSLIGNMLIIEEADRINIGDVLSHPWLKIYYKRYSPKLVKQSIQQKLKNQKQKTMSMLPYYLAVV